MSRDYLLSYQIMFIQKKKLNRLFGENKKYKNLYIGQLKIYSYMHIQKWWRKTIENILLIIISLYYDITTKKAKTIELLNMKNCLFELFKISNFGLNCIIH